VNVEDPIDTDALPDPAAPSGRAPAGEDVCTIAVTRVEGEPVVVVTGEVDLAAADRLWQAIESIPDDRPVVVDLEGVTFLDSSGLAVLVRALRARDCRRDALVLRHPKAHVSWVLEVTGVDRAVVVEP
jgi:anti-anti-sigma factor